MRAVLMVVTNILGEQSLQMAFIHRDNVVQQVVSATFDPTLRLCIAKIKSACEINNIQRRRVTCYMDENRLVRSFGEGHV